MSIRQLPDWTNGEQLTSGDLARGIETALDKAGEALSYLVGITSMQDKAQPLQWSVDAFNNVTIGGSNQRCVLGGRECDEIGAGTFPVPINSTGSARVDTIYGIACETPTGGNSREVKIGSSSVITVSVPDLQQNVSWTLVPQGGTLPSLPTGATGAAWVAVLQITVPASSGIGGVTAGDLKLLLQTGSQALTLPFINLDAYPGRDVLGATPNAVILQQAYADAVTLGISEIRFSGKLLCEAQITPADNIALVGGGSLSCQIIQGTATNHVFVATTGQGLEFRGFAVIGYTGGGGSTSGHAFSFTNVNVLKMSDIDVSTIQASVFLSGCTDLRWYSVYIHDVPVVGLFATSCFLGNFFDCDFSNCGTEGVLCTGTNNSGAGWHWKFYGGRAVQNNAFSGGGSGFYIDTGLGGFEFYGFAFGNIAAANPAVNPQQYGLILFGGNDYVKCFGCGMIGNATGPVQIGGTIGAHVVFRDCPGYNPIGTFTGGGAPTMPSSGVPLPNPYGAGAMVYVSPSGATITNIQVGAGTVATSPTAMTPVWVPAGLAITINYSSGPPTWVWTVE